MTYDASPRRRAFYDFAREVVRMIPTGDLDPAIDALEERLAELDEAEVALRRDIVDRTIAYALDRVLGDMDELLLAIGEGKGLDPTRLRRLPPWRAVMLARVAVRAGAMPDQDLATLITDAVRVGGGGTLPPAT